MAGEKGKAAFAGAAVTAAAIAILLASRKVEAQPPVTLDDATMQTLLGLLQGSENIDTDLDSVVAILNDLKDGMNQLALAISQLVGGGGVMCNPKGGVAWRTVCPAANTPYQLPSRRIPYDKELAIKALPANGGNIYVAFSAIGATNIGDSYPLIANEAIHYKIYDSEVIWISATAAGEGVVCTVEQEV